MNALKNLLSSLLGSNVSKKEASKDALVKPAVDSRHQERSDLIDQIVASWGNDLQARHRYFGLS